MASIQRMDGKPIVPPLIEDLLMHADRNPEMCIAWRKNMFWLVFEIDHDAPGRNGRPTAVNGRVEKSFNRRSAA